MGGERPASRSATCSSSCRSRCRWCSSSPRGCSCGPSSRSPRAIWASIRERIMVVAIDAERSKVTPEQRAVLFDRVATAVAAVPGVDRAAASAITPVSGSMWNDRFENPERPGLSERERSVNQNYVTPGWFATYGTPMIAGRDFTDRDTAGSPSVVIVNETFAREIHRKARARWAARSCDEPPRSSSGRPLEIVGVRQRCGISNRSASRCRRRCTVRSRRRRTSPPFLSVSVDRDERFAVAADAKHRGRHRPARSRYRADLPAARRTGERRARAGTGRRDAVRILRRARAAARRDRALRRDVLRGQPPPYRDRHPHGARRGAAASSDSCCAASRCSSSSALPSAPAISLWAARFVSTLLYGLEPRDPVTLIGASAVLALIGALAGWLPARRAARIDPAEVLRQG